MSWKSNKYYIFGVCVYSLFYSACNVLAPDYIATCDLSVPHYSILSHERNDFREKLLNIKCVFRFSLQLLSEHF